MQVAQPLEEHDASLAWFTQFQQNYVIKNGVVPEWFHGAISRNTAEDMLRCRPQGCFLIRVSQTRIGYTLSYRAGDRCRHFMIDAHESGLYSITGEDTYHQTLQDLVDFHRRVPIPPFKELLTSACVKTNASSNIAPGFQFRFNLTDFEPSSQNLASTSFSNHACSPMLYPSLDTEVSTANLQSPNMVDMIKPVPLPRRKLNSVTFEHQVKTEQAKLPLGCTGSDGGEETRARRMNFNMESPTSGQSRAKRMIKLMHFKKKRHVKKTGSGEHVYSEISQESGTLFPALDNGNANVRTCMENVYQEFLELSPITDTGSVPVARSDHMTSLIQQPLPEEYLLPPPFAPGY